MERMKIKLLFHKITLSLLVVLLFAACGMEKFPLRSFDKPGGGRSESLGKSRGESPGESTAPAELSQIAEIADTLQRIAEIERSGVYIPGLALTESALRERAGDFSGAAVAAYKELSWAYAYGAASKAEVEEGLLNTIVALQDSGRQLAIDALRGCLAFAREEWAQAEKLLKRVFSPNEEADSFLRWMLLVCAIEQEATESEAATLRSAYGAIRGRYSQFPEYWHRGARAFSGRDGEIAAAYAEQCINLSPRGPFALDSRKLLAAHFGISSNRGNEHSALLTKAEIENIIRNSVSINDPDILKELIPLLALPENPLTLYALGALKVLSSVPEYRIFFMKEAQTYSGRLGERLNFLSRG